MFVRRLLFASLAAGCFASSATAEEIPYLDDRSTADVLVQSLYNAVNRKEYARAWSYFGDAKPSDTVETFTRGFSDTKSIEVKTGTVTAEGAAGSAYFNVPVALEAKKSDGSAQVFTGCYVARLSNPQIQTPPYNPMLIEGGKLEASQKPLDDALPEKCAETPAPLPPKDLVLEQAKAAFAAMHADNCDVLKPGGDFAKREPASFDLSYVYRLDKPDAADRKMRLFRFFCSAGAYNENHVYFSYEDKIGLREIHFATPELDIRYEDDNPEGKVDEVSVIGYTAADRLVNSSFDKDTLTIISAANWRAAGDASSTGTWILRDGTFTLVKYEVDASFDGQVNPESVMDYHTGP